MKAQHKTLIGGLGYGKVWILAQQPIKENWLMDQKDSLKKQQQQKQWRGLRLGETGLRTENKYISYLEPPYEKPLYPTRQNHNNIFALLVTGKDKDDDEKR